jgi:hypothetical protein
MNTNSIIKSLNLTDGEVLTLDKLTDRLEFEAFSGVAGAETNDADLCGFYIDDSGCPDCLDCPELSPSILNPCDCDGPVTYTAPHPCGPYRN